MNIVAACLFCNRTRHRARDPLDPQRYRRRVRERISRGRWNKIEADVLKLLAMPEIKQRLVDLGVDVEPQNSTEFTAFFRAETARWIKTAREAGIALQ